jgi:hypothetical protein
MVRMSDDKKALATQFADDVARMQRCLNAIGKHVADDKIIYAWADYSGGLCADWLMLPEKDADLLKILLKQLPSSPLTWQATIQDAGDGSGDQVLKLPDEIIGQLGWQEGDTLCITKLGSDELAFKKELIES